jgi:hypothetical protein
MSLYNFVDDGAIPWRLAFSKFSGNEKGTVLKGARLREELAQKQLSEMTGIPQRHFSKMEPLLPQPKNGLQILSVAALSKGFTAKITKFKAVEHLWPSEKWVDAHSEP